MVIKLKSEEGASFSVALLLLLLCAVVSSILLAASTASAGQFANRGQMDQRYFSVMSAAKIFSGSLDGGSPSVAGGGAADDGTLQFSFTQSKTGTRTVTRASNGTVTQGEVVVQADGTEAKLLGPSSTEGFDFLADLTCYALAGTANDESLTSSLRGKAWNSWIEPFAEGAWASASESLATGLKSSEGIEYEITPTLTGAGVSGDAMVVEATARLNSDWTLEVEFHDKAGSPDERFYLYMLFTADVDTSDSTNEEVTGTSSNPSSESTSTEQKLTSKKTTTVTWHLDQIVPGRGLASNA